MLDYDKITNEEFYEWFLATLATPKNSVAKEVLSQ